MSFDHILINLKRELIRTFAVTDEWFDREHPLRCFKPSSGGWSINEVLEHVMLTNHYLLILIEKGADKALRASSTTSVSGLQLENYSLVNPAMLEIAQPDAFTWERPEHHQPTGQTPMQEVRRTMRDQLEQYLYILDLLPNGEGILHRTTMSVNNLGKLDVYQYLYFLALHAQRHIQQMNKVEQEFNMSPVAPLLSL
jgi:hypothetical protein